MKREEAIAELDAMDKFGDNEIMHSIADEILLELLRAEGFADVADAWERAEERAGFWYA